MLEILDLTALRLPRGKTLVRTALAVHLVSCIFGAGAACAAGMSVTDAWTAPNPNIGSDALLGMVLKNEDADADALLRVSCPVANFSENRQIDVGEGSKSARAIRSIPIPGKSSLTLSNDKLQIALLQITKKLDLGEGFVCSLSFRRGGKIEVPVKVLEQAPGAKIEAAH